MNTTNFNEEVIIVINYAGEEEVQRPATQRITILCFTALSTVVASYINTNNKVSYSSLDLTPFAFSIIALFFFSLLAETLASYHPAAAGCADFGSSLAVASAFASLVAVLLQPHHRWIAYTSSCMAGCMAGASPLLNTTALRRCFGSAHMWVRQHLPPGLFGEEPELELKPEASTQPV